MAKPPKVAAAAPSQPVAGARATPVARGRLDRPPSYPCKATLALELDVREPDILKLVERGVIPKPFDLPGIGPRWDWELCRLALAGGVGAIIAEDPYLVGARNATASQ